MKKNISINISGIIFHIEEDGYDHLKNYLDSIIRYFSAYEDSQEIIADIENRIAEIFSGKLNKGKEVITQEDVAFVISTMGTISDFKAAEDKEGRSQSSDEKQSGSAQKENTETASAPKKLFRDTRRKLLGGVAAGIADHLRVDPIWIRLAIIAVFFGISFIPPLSGLTLLTYIILWIVLPPSTSTENEENIKKLYRDPVNRVIAGVCGGLAAYFGADTTLIRLLFVIGLFLGGSTLLVYIVLLAITPEAKTTTEKMKMQGEPLTLSNIESEIKKNFNLKNDKEDSVITKILIFPFKIISEVFSALSKGLGPVLFSLGEVVRIVMGASFIFIPLVVFAVLLLTLGIIVGVIDYTIIPEDLAPLDLVIEEIPKLSAMALLVVMAIPMVFLSILGVNILAKRNVIHPAFAWIFLGFFAIAFVVAASTIPGYVKDFKKEASVEEEQIFLIRSKTIFLKANPNENVEYNKVRLYLKGYAGKDVKLVKEYYSRGSSVQNAIQNGKMIDYGIQQKDSTLTFDWNFNFKENAVFRGQQLKLTLYIPYGKEFVIKEDMDEIIREESLFMDEGEEYKMEGSRWTFPEDGGVACFNCTELEKGWEEENN